MNTALKLIDQSVNNQNEIEIVNTFLKQANTRTASSSHNNSDAYNFNPSLLGSLKAVLVQKLSSEYSELGKPLVTLAVDEAQSLAAQTAVPFLVLPVLAEEKVLALRKWSARQRVLLQRRALAFAV